MKSKFKSNLTVAEDNIFKDQIIRELKSAETWNNDWGFLVTKGTLLHSCVR